MNNEFHLSIGSPPPSINGCFGHTNKWRYKTSKYKDWQQYVYKHLTEQYKYEIEHIEGSKGNFRLKSKHLKGQNSIIGDKPFKLILRQRFRTKIKRDLDNYIKPLLDTLEGLIFDNDNQLYQLGVTKEIGCGFDEFDLTFYY